jgi:MFS family permease
MSLSSFFQYGAHFALIATLPIFVIDTLRGNDWQTGLTMTFFQFGAIFCRPLVGKWIDEIDKGTMLLLSLGMFLVVCIMYLGVGGLYFLLLVRLLHGAVFATATTTVATVAALVLPPQRKGEGIGYFAMFPILAMVVGPFLSLIIVACYQFQTLFAWCVVCAALSFWFGNRNRLSNITSKAVAPKDRTFTWKRFIEPKALPVALTGGLLFFAYTGVLVFLPLYAKQLNIPEYTSGFFAVFALAILATRPVVGKLFDRCGANTVVYPGFLMFMLGLIGLSQVQGFFGFLAAGVIIGAGFGALSPAFLTLAIQASPEYRTGVATATYFWALDISVGLGSVFMSVVASHAGYRDMYLLAAAVIGISAAVYYVLRPQKHVPANK